MPKRYRGPFGGPGARLGGRAVRRRYRKYGATRMGRLRVGARAAAIRGRAIARFTPYGRAALGAYTGYSLMKSLMARKRLHGTPKRAITQRDYTIGSALTYATIGRKTLVASEITHNQGVNASNLRGIATKKFYLSGMKMCMKYRSNSNFSVRVHYAIVQNKEDLFDDTSILDSVNTKWFASKANTDERFIDYVNASTDTAWNNNYDCLPINNRRWNILFHKRFTLGPRDGSAADNQNLNNWKVVDKWIPVKKVFEFRDPDAASTTDRARIRKPLYFVTWYDFTEDNRGTGGDVVRANVFFDSYTRAVG